MILKQKEFEKVLEEYVDNYVLLKEVMDMDDLDDEDLFTEVTEGYEIAEQKLLEFEAETYGEEEPDLPNMEAYYSETGYSAFAYRIYSGILEARQMAPEEEWNIYLMVYIGKLLNERYGKE